MNTSETWSINYIFIGMPQLKRIIKDIMIQRVFLIMVLKIIICTMTILTMHMKVITFITMNTIHGMQVTHT